MNNIQQNNDADRDPFKDCAFRGNQNIREGVVSVPVDVNEFTYYANEIVKCAEDPIYFANTYFTIVAPGKGKHVIKTYPRQDDLINEMVEKDRLVVLASRQVGKTTSYNIALLHMCLFNKDKKVLILANKGAAAIEFMSRIRMAYEMLPKWLKPGVLSWNKGSIEFSNGSKVEACSTSPDSARGKSCDVLVIDECAFVPPNLMEELWASVYPVISSAKGTKVILVSTPNGSGNLFHELYEAGCTDSEDGWKSFKFMWFDVPGRDDAWKRKQIASFNGDMAKWNQEFGCEFIGSTYTLVPPEALTKYKEYFQKDFQKPFIKKYTKIFGTYEATIYEDPKPGRCYSVGVDVADGVGGDSSIITIYDITEPLKSKQVAYYASANTPTSALPYIIAELAVMFNMAPIMVEANGIGGGVVDMLYSVYEYMYIPSVGHKKMGVYSSNKTKLEGCSNFRSMLTCLDTDITINNGNITSEMENFEKVETRNGTSYRARLGNDDNMMATIWAFYIFSPEIVNYYYEPVYQNINLSNLPVMLKPLMTEQEIKKEQDYYFKRLKEVKQIVDIHSGISDNLETYSSHQPVINNNSLQNNNENVWNTPENDIHSRPPRFFNTF